MAFGSQVNGGRRLLGAKLACLEMIKNGITVFNDMYWHWEATAKAVCDTGIRGYISAVFIDMFDEKTSKDQIAKNIELFEISEKYRPNVTFIFGPHAIYTVSKASLEWMRAFSESNDVLIHMHVSETENEVAFQEKSTDYHPSNSSSPRAYFPEIYRLSRLFSR